MDIIRLKFPDKDLTEHNFKLLSYRLQQESKRYLKLFIRANNKNYRIERQRLQNIVNYLNSIYKTKVNIYKIILYIFKSLKLDKERNYLYIDDRDKLYDIKLIDLFRIINYGSLGCNRSNMIRDLIEMAFTKIRVESVILEWGWI